jgi:hypothetical protein
MRIVGAEALRRDRGLMDSAAILDSNNWKPAIGLQQLAAGNRKPAIESRMKRVFGC